MGDRAKLDSVDTVNGGIRLGENVRAGSLESVNGGLRIEEGSRVAGTVSSVNGGIWMGKDAQVTGKVATVNGKMELEHAHVGGGLQTVNGNITLGSGSRVEGGILVEKPSFSLFNWQRRTPRIVIGPDATVEGTLRFEQEVELYVSDRAKIGRVEGAKTKTFSGENP